MIRLLFLSILLSLTTILFGQEISPELEREIQRRVKEEINPSISIALLHANGTCSYYNYGEWRRSNRQKTDSLKLYEIGSLTKTFTASLTTLYLRDALDSSILTFFPEIKNEELEALTPGALRNHIAGVPRLSAQFSPKDWSNPFKGYSDSMLYEELESLLPDTTNTWAYSNFGYAILGKTLERASRQSFEDLMSELLQRAGMTNTHLKHSPEAVQQLADPINLGATNTYWNFTGPSRYAGGLLSCTSDLIEYLRYQQKANHLFLTDSLPNLKATGIHDLGKDQLFYSSGWFVFRPEKGVDIVLHNGATGAYNSFIAYNKQSKEGVVVLANSMSLIDDIGLHLLYSSFDLRKPQRTIAYELADEVEQGKSDALLQHYKEARGRGQAEGLLDVYWLERYHFGRRNYMVSNQLSDILIESLPEDWEVWDIKGQNLEALERWEEAIAAYQKALSLNPVQLQLKEKIQVCVGRQQD